LTRSFKNLFVVELVEAWNHKLEKLLDLRPVIFAYLAHSSGKK